MRKQSRGGSKVVPFRQTRRRERRSGWLRRARELGPIMLMLPLAAFTAVFFWDGGPRGWAFPLPDTSEPVASGSFNSDRFSRCVGPVRRTCVIDGDTFWLHGQKIRIADINTPETGEPKCASEAERGEAATARLVELLNDGGFTLRRTDRDTDSYGRQLRIVERGGKSIGDQLIAEGLAEPWRGRRGDWCGGAHVANR